MTPKEKAKELIDKMNIKHYMKLHSRPQIKGLPISMYNDQIKQCALICIDEIIKEHNEVSKNFKWQDERWEWLKEVKQKIENYEF